MSRPYIIINVAIIAMGITLLGPASSMADTTAPSPGPYDRQVAEQLARLKAESPTVRAGAVEALGFLRAYQAEGPLIGLLDDSTLEVRRQAAMALAWCGGRAAVEPLLAALEDDDWAVRQAAWVSLTNLTGMEFPFDCHAPPAERATRIRHWRQWWDSVPADRPPREVLEWLAAFKPRDDIRSITASTTYKGPPNVLLDGRIGPAYWQTKNVKPPQWCTVDLGKPEDVERVTVHQYAENFVMTECELATSLDGKSFEVVQRLTDKTPVRLEFEFPPRRARFVRVTSFGSVTPLYPTTFFELEVNRPNTPQPVMDAELAWRLERGCRALGALGGRGATEAILELLGPMPRTDKAFRPVARTAIRALGRLREEAGFQALLGLLEQTAWARDAADALGDFGDPRAVAPLIDIYPRYAKKLDGTNPAELPSDDKMGFPSEDRMLETPYLIELALCRLPLDDPRNNAALRRIGPLIMINMQGDHDTFMLYEPESGHLVTRHLLEAAGLRQEACERAMIALGQPRRAAKPEDELEWSELPAYRMASWLPAVSTEPKDLPRLAALLEHEEGFVRINAAKAMAWQGDPRAIGPLAQALRDSKPEAAFGYSGTFKDEEYNDPAPRWREALVRALGLLGAEEQTEPLITILNDEQNVLEVRHAAAEALADLGNQRALDALEKAARDHGFQSVRHVARDAVRAAGRRIVDDSFRKKPVSDFDFDSTSNSVSNSTEERASDRVDTSHNQDDASRPFPFDAIVFIQGSNDIPNTLGTVEQADRWRQTYVVTDSGPVYRPGQNLCVLRPARPDGRVTRLTDFKDGYVGDLELSWDGTHAIFARRGQEDPWWQVWRINVDGTGLKQLTRGPYHHVGPAYLPDGRIVLATSRHGIRDEYHGYPTTSLWVMDPDGSGLHPIATNIGRDNEPAVLGDGRIVFSRLEVFYSRNKTELTLHAMHPDGTKDVVLYGPERRAYWRALDHGPRTPADGQEKPATHRVLRMTQPQPMADGRHVIVATQGGLVLVGPRRDTETHVTPDYQQRAYTTPFPLSDGRVLCASSLKNAERAEVDVGLYVLDPATGKLELVYNDPALAEFEPRPIRARALPPVLLSKDEAPRGYHGTFFCASVFNTQEEVVRRRGRLIRLIEGRPVVARHSTHTNDWPVWKNHGGTFARVLGTAPLGPDGSFYAKVPADRLLHFQVLDSDRRVVGNQLTWINARPGEVKSCMGCHESPHAVTAVANPWASHQRPLEFLPNGDEFTYRAKAWYKGDLPAEIEHRTRTVRAVNLLGR